MQIHAFMVNASTQNPFPQRAPVSLDGVCGGSSHWIDEKKLWFTVRCWEFCWLRPSKPLHQFVMIIVPGATCFRMRRSKVWASLQLSGHISCWTFFVSWSTMPRTYCPSTRCPWWNLRRLILHSSISRVWFWPAMRGWLLYLWSSASK